LGLLLTSYQQNQAQKLLVSLTTPQLSEIINGLNANQLSLISPRQMSALSPQTLKTLSPRQLSALTEEQVAILDKSQLAVVLNVK
jgi:hypothetical protein